MRPLRELYDFVTGGSLVAPAGVAIALVVAFTLPLFREQAFALVLLATLAGSTFETIR